MSSADDHSEDITFPCVELKGSPNPKPKNIYLITGLFSGAIILLLGVIIFLICFFSVNRNKGGGGGYLTLKYKVKSKEDSLIINPSNVLKKGDYSIKINKNKENNLRLLDENSEIINNRLISKNDGIIEIEIEFKNILNSMSNLFENCENLTYIDLSKLKSERIKSMNSTFLNCHKLEDIKIKGNYKNLETMDYAFKNSTSLVNIDLSELKLEKLESMKSIFENCINLTKVDLS